MDTPDDTKPRRKAAPPIAAPVPALLEGGEPRDEAPSVETAVPLPLWLRFTGQQSTVFPALGGEVAPGTLVRPGGDALTASLLARGDFQPADAPIQADSTAN